MNITLGGKSFDSIAISHVNDGTLRRLEGADGLSYTLHHRYGAAIAVLDGADGTRRTIPYPYDQFDGNP